MPADDARPTRTTRAPRALRALAACGVLVAFAASPTAAWADAPSGPSQSPAPSAASTQGDIAGEWALDAAHFDAQRIWQVTRGAGVTVAVVDSGVDAAHPDLAGQVLPGVSLLGDGGDGRSDISGESHGTAIAALIAGTGTSAHGRGIIGLSPAAKILPVRVATGNEVSTPLLAQGIIWAADHGARVINVSSGNADPDPLLKKAVAYAERKDAVVVASAGNNGQAGNEIQYPAGFPGVVAVSGTDQSGAFWPTSESGPDITVAAPAAQIASASDNGQYVQADGTSYAAGYVSAALALIRSHDPHLTAGQAIAALIAATRDHRSVPDDKLGYGEIDPLAALTAAVPTATGNPLLVARRTAHGSATLWWWAVGGTATLASAASLTIVLTRRKRRPPVTAPPATGSDKARGNRPGAKPRTTAEAPTKSTSGRGNSKKQPMKKQPANRPKTARR